MVLCGDAESQHRASGSWAVTARYRAVKARPDKEPGGLYYADLDWYIYGCFSYIYVFVYNNYFRVYVECVTARVRVT